MSRPQTKDDEETLSIAAARILAGWPFLRNGVSRRLTASSLASGLRACEAAWETQYNAEARRAATNHLKQAIQFFFALKLADAARELDAARFDLRWPSEPTLFARWAESLFVKPESRLVDAGAEALPFTLGQAYQSPNGIQPQDARLRLTLLLGKQVVGRTYETKLAALPFMTNYLSRD
jgi:hypothetical protein